MSVERELGMLTASVEGLREEFRTHVEREERWRGDLCQRLTDRLDNHGKRLRALERWRAWILGGMATVAAAWAAFKVFLIGRIS